MEVVTDAMLDRLINTHPHVAAFFYDKDGHQASLKALEVLETIDDDVYDHSQIKMVKIDDPEEALEYGLKSLPALVFFEHKMPNIFEGNLLEAHKVSSWITDIAMEDKIEFVTAAMLEKLLDDYMNIAVFIHDRQVIFLDSNTLMNRNDNAESGRNVKKSLKNCHCSSPRCTVLENLQKCLISNFLRAQK